MIAKKAIIILSSLLTIHYCAFPSFRFRPDEGPCYTKLVPGLELDIYLERVHVVMVSEHYDTKDLLYKMFIIDVTTIMMAV